MTDKPKWMPAPTTYIHPHYLFTADQLAAVRREAIERAATICRNALANKCAEAILSMKEDE